MKRKNREAKMSRDKIKSKIFSFLVGFAEGESDAWSFQELVDAASTHPHVCLLLSVNESRELWHFTIFVCLFWKFNRTTEEFRVDEGITKDLTNKCEEIKKSTATSVKHCIKNPFSLISSVYLSHRLTAGR